MMIIQKDKLILLNDAMVVRPATTADIEEANNELENLSLPPIPSGYADFLQQCNGFAFNGVELFGTDMVSDPETGFELMDMVSFIEQQHGIYVEQMLDWGIKDLSEEALKYIFPHDLLFFGRVDDDIFSYNPQTQKYESRDINSYEIWDEYPNFEDFWQGEISKYLPEL